MKGSLREGESDNGCIRVLGSGGPFARTHEGLLKSSDILSSDLKDALKETVWFKGAARGFDTSVINCTDRDRRGRMMRDEVGGPSPLVLISRETSAYEAILEALQFDISPAALELLWSAYREDQQVRDILNERFGHDADYRTCCVTPLELPQPDIDQLVNFSTYITKRVRRLLAITNTLLQRP